MLSSGATLTALTPAVFRRAKMSAGCAIHEPMAMSGLAAIIGSTVRRRWMPMLGLLCRTGFCTVWSRPTISSSEPSAATMSAVSGVSTTMRCAWAAAVRAKRVARTRCLGFMEFPLRVSDGFEGFAFNNPINDGFFTEKSDCRAFAADGNGFQFGLSDAYGLLGKQRNQRTSNSF